MNPYITSQFRMEGAGEEIPLSDCNRRTVDLAEYGDAVMCLLNDWRSYKDCVKRPLPELRNGNICLKAVNLPAVGIAANGNIHQVKRRHFRISDMLCHKDHTGACGEDGKSAVCLLFQGSGQIIISHELAHGGAFATGYDKSVNCFKLGWKAKRYGGNLKTAKNGKMLGEVSL